MVRKFGVPPVFDPDYLALVGDAADGYPGLPGWGAKSTAAVLAKFVHLESIPRDSSAWGLTPTCRCAGAYSRTGSRARLALSNARHAPDRYSALR